MSRDLALWTCLAFIGWLLYRDAKTRPKVSAATWLPTLWLIVLSSRPVSTWFADTSVLSRDASYSLDGSPIDRWVFLSQILGAIWVLQKRRTRWGQFLAANKGTVVLYAYLALTICWASSPFVSGKRWIKDFGNVLMVLVILSENNPTEAIRAVFVRAAYVLLPLSVLVLRYFPEIGRTYNRWTGEMEAVGLTFQKNSLGAEVLVAGLILAWDIFHRLQLRSLWKQKFDIGIRCFVILLGGYLLKVSDSKTATLCLALGALMIAGVLVPAVRRNAGKVAGWGGVAGLALFAADRAFGIIEWFVQSIGRNMTLTGRTNIWDELLKLPIDPLWGSGFLNLWSDFRYLNVLPEFATHSAHNGYLEIYFDGGLVGVALLSLMLISVTRKINRDMAAGNEYGMVRFAVLVVVLIYNISESNLFRMTPVWFLFLVAAIEYPRPRFKRTAQPNRPAAGLPLNLDQEVRL